MSFADMHFCPNTGNSEKNLAVFSIMIYSIFNILSEGTERNGNNAEIKIPANPAYIKAVIRGVMNSDAKIPPGAAVPKQSSEYGTVQRNAAEESETAFAVFPGSIQERRAENKGLSRYIPVSEQ